MFKSSLSNRSMRLGLSIAKTLHSVLDVIMEAAIFFSRCDNHKLTVEIQGSCCKVIYSLFLLRCAWCGQTVIKVSNDMSMMPLYVALGLPLK